MTLPSATYRVQFRNGMTFDHACGLVPYLKSLGISHLYASPVFTATRGSTHGYDVTDASEIDPALGGRAGFDRLTETLSRSRHGPDPGHRAEPYGRFTGECLVAERPGIRQA